MTFQSYLESFFRTPTTNARLNMPLLFTAVGIALQALAAGTLTVAAIIVSIGQPLTVWPLAATLVMVVVGMGLVKTFKP